MARRRKKGPPELPVASFADIAFLLIIFFILVTNLSSDMGFEADLPSGEKGETQQKKAISVQIHDRDIALNDKKVSMKELEASLRAMDLAAKQNTDDKVVLLEAAGRARYQDYYEVMSIVNDVGGVIAIVRAAGEE